jgi:hypothetical protein
MSTRANKVVEQAKAWLGRNEASGTHKAIIDVYNAHKPLARGYAVKYTDSWCATFVSAVAIATGCTDIIPLECGCQQQIELFKKLGSWDESDARVPNPGDIIYYDWNDSGKGDNVGWSDHVGIVEKVSFNQITVIEGNYHNAVKRRILSVNAKNIRGYGLPKYGTKAAEKPQNKPETVVAKKETTAKATYSLTQFIKDVQKATGAKIDGIAGKETLSKTVTVSAKVNSKHAVVKAIQKRLNALGFDCGAVDGVIGNKTTAAIMAYQKTKNCIVDGEITARNKTWQHLLEII